MEIVVPILPVLDNPIGLELLSEQFNFPDITDPNVVPVHDLYPSLDLARDQTLGDNIIELEVESIFQLVNTKLGFLARRHAKQTLTTTLDDFDPIEQSLDLFHIKMQDRP